MWKNLRQFCESKSPKEDVFNLLTTNSLNAKLTSFMPGLTAKVFRTYNASVTLEKQLKTTYPAGTSVEEMVTQYNDANREVAILCNHQRTLPKNWDESNAKKRGKLELLEREGGGLTERTLEIICGGMDIPVTVGDGGAEDLLYVLRRYLQTQMRYEGDRFRR